MLRRLGEDTAANVIIWCCETQNVTVKKFYYNQPHCLRRNRLRFFFWLCVHNGGDLASKSPNKTERPLVLSARLCGGIIGQVMPRRLSKEFGCAGIGDSGNVPVFPKAPPGSDCSTNTPPVTHIPGDKKTHTSIGLCSVIIFAKAFHSYTNSRCSHKPSVPSALTLAHNMPTEPRTDILTHTHT